MLTLSSINIYPVKSLGGISLKTAQVQRRGLEYDREWMVVDPSGHFVTQREIPQMALIETAITSGALVLSHNSHGQISVPLDTTQHAARNVKDLLSVRVWKDLCPAYDQGDEAADFLSDFLDKNVRLVRMEHGFERRVDQDYAISQSDIVGFADGFPVLVISEESLVELNEKLEFPLPMNRFRPNITVSGGTAFVEDSWSEIAVGASRLALRKPCARCPITTIDQETAEMSKEPLRTLSFFRKQNGKVMFGQNAVVLKTGAISIGDKIETTLK
jgi:uncharacterized protein